MWRGHNGNKEREREREREKERGDWDQKGGHLRDLTRFLLQSHPTLAANFSNFLAPSPPFLLHPHRKKT